jgi:predicted RNA-binding protein with TRAM domain
MYGNDRRGGSGRGFGRGGGGFGHGGGFSRGGGGYGRQDSFDKPKPVKIGEEYDVKITDVGAKGDGITKIENFIVFVAGAKKGEECRIRIKEVANKFAIGEKVGASENKDEAEKTDEATDEAVSEEGATDEEPVEEESTEESDE